MRRLTASPLLLLVALLGPVGGASASDGKGNFAVKGVGTTSCRDYLRARAAGGDAYLLYGGYIGGYVTAINQLQPRTFDVLPWQSVDTVTRMLASFCAKSPDSLFAAVLSRLAKLLQADRITEPSPAVRAGGEVDGVTMYAEALRRAQVKLAELELYQGSPDGRFDAHTREALERFQLDKALPRTGLPDQVTLFMLYYPPKTDDGS